jgi:hypothetical protein
MLRQGFGRQYHFAFRNYRTRKKLKKRTNMQIWTWDGFGHGTFVLRFPFGTNIINRHTHVVASICEIAQPPGGPLDFPFIGDASMQVLNVAPEDDGNVYMRIAVGWESTLNWRATFFISP